MGKEEVKINIKELEDSFKKVLHLNGEYLGAEVGKSVNPPRDIKTLCHIGLNLCEYITKMDWKIKVLYHKTKELEKCCTNTVVQDAEKETSETS